MKTPGFRIALSLLLFVTLVLFGLVPGVAGAAGYGPIRSISEYKLNEASGSPEGITTGPDGAMWFGEGASKIGRITLSGTIKEFECPDTGGYISDITTGPDGALWFCEGSPQDPRSRGNRLGRITTSGAVTIFGGLPGFHSLASITAGPDGALWFTDGGACKIGRITTAGVVTEFDDPDGFSPLDITAGPDGALWFTDINRICRITTAGHITQHALPGDPTNTSATGICVGPDGALWFTVSAFNDYGPDPGAGSCQVGRMTTAGALTEYDVSSPDMWLGDIAPGADGALWFTETKFNQDTGTIIENIGRMTTTGAFTEYCTPSASECRRISQGPAGTIWATEAMPEEAHGMIAQVLVYPPVPAPTRWKSAAYFAEGYTGAGFQEYVCIQNPNAAPADAWLTYMTSDGTSDTQYLTLAPTSRMTVDVNQLAGAGRELSVRVVSTSPGLVVERPMYFNYEGKWTGGHDVLGVAAPATAFYFAEGTCRPNFDTYFCIQNPGDTAANVRLTYMKGDGTTSLQSFAVKPHSRYTIRPKDKLGEGNDPAHDFSTKVECTNWQPIVCERPTYFNYRGVWTGGHDVTGVSAPASTYHFAEGTCRPDFDPYFCVFNPGDKDAAVTVNLTTGDFRTKARKLTVGKHSRATVRAKDVLGEGNDKAHDFSPDVVCTNGQQIVCERPMYFNYQGNWTGGSDVMGATHLSKKFCFAEGSSRPGIDQYFSVWNPDSDPNGIKITYMFTDGTVLEQHQDIEARATVDCRAFLAGAGKLGCDFSATVTTMTGGDFLMERPMYFDFNGWTGGHDVIGYTGAN